MRVGRGLSAITEWYISSFSNGNGCVEVRRTGDVVLVRDSKARSGGVISIPAVWWKLFLDNVTTRRHTRNTLPIPLPAIEPTPHGGAVLRAADGTTLHFNNIEWRAFTAGIHADEFALV
jgi:hypothetical protein